MPRPEALRVTFSAIGEDLQGKYVQVAIQSKDQYGDMTGVSKRLRLGEALRFAFGDPRLSIRLMKPERKEEG